MKGAISRPCRPRPRTTQPHAGESFIDTLWMPGLLLIAVGTALIAGHGRGVGLWQSARFGGARPDRRCVGDGGRSSDHGRTPTGQAGGTALAG